MTVQVAFTVKDGPHTRGEVLDLDDLDGMALARVDEVIHEIRSHLERLARVRAARVAKETP